MPATHLTRGLPPVVAATAGTGRISIFVERLLCLLEKVSDEAFWNGLFGDRILNLLKRYFGSDVVFLGFIVYLARMYIYIIFIYRESKSLTYMIFQQLLLVINCIPSFIIL
jgi:hypothetical protein